MKTSLATQQVQDWSLLNLRPMHRALLRRSVEQSVSRERNRSDRHRELSWHLESWLDSTQQALLELMSRPGVLVVDFEGLQQRVLEDRVEDSVIESAHFRSKDQIRLLWHWSLRGRQNLLWCTEMSFDGVICDPQSLAQWIRVCMRHGKLNEGQSNRLLSGIRLPSLAIPNSMSD